MAATPLDPAKRPRTQSSAPLSPEENDNWRVHVALTPGVQLRIRKSSVSEAAVPASAAQASPELQVPAEQGEISRGPSRDRRLTPCISTDSSPTRCAAFSGTDAACALPTPPATPVVVADVASRSSNLAATQAEGKQHLSFTLYTSVDHLFAFRSGSTPFAIRAASRRDRKSRQAYKQAKHEAQGVLGVIRYTSLRQWVDFLVT